MSIFKKLIDFLNLFEKPEALPSPNTWLAPNAVSVAVNLVTIDTSKLIRSLSRPPKVWAVAIPPTGSMDNTFDAGTSNILIAGSTPEDHEILVSNLKEGDIAVYQRDTGFLIIHRIVKIEGETYWFKGDNNPIQDSPVLKKDILWIWVANISVLI